ncbi:hypothetical protein RIF29_34046 [Crotalaria pallida]|uniref:Uncharacterized protein n=1 Tax=Crotalaria pallida TaxID=3830 RepID=A0AAN9HT57_CROPI
MGPVHYNGNNTNGKSLIEDHDPDMIMEAANHISDSNGMVNTVNPEINDSSPFGPWMLVRGIPRMKGKGFDREGIKNGSNKEILSPNIKVGSRFNVLETEDAGCEVEDLNVQNSNAMKEPCNLDTAQMKDKAKGNFGISHAVKIRNSKGGKNPQSKQASIAQPKNNPEIKNQPSMNHTHPSKAQGSIIEAPSSSSKPDRSLMKEIEKQVLLRMKDLERNNPNLLDKVATQVHYSSYTLQNPLHGFSPTTNDLGFAMFPPNRDASQPVSIQNQRMEIDGGPNVLMEEKTQPNVGISTFQGALSSIEHDPRAFSPRSS